MTDAEDLDYTHFTNQHNSTRHFSKSESTHKGKKNIYVIELRIFFFLTILMGWWKNQMMSYRSLEWQNKLLFLLEHHYSILHLLKNIKDKTENKTP